MSIKIDTSYWPVAVVLPSGQVSDDELQTFLSDYSKLIRLKREPYVLVIDLRLASDLKATQRKAITNYMQKQEEFARVYCYGTVLVFSSALMRALLTGILWIRTPPQPLFVSATLEEASEWARKQLGRARRLSQPV